MMRAPPIKIALKHLGAWCLVLVFAALLTVVFSFLGTLFCAAMGGLMMGATRASQRLAISFSLLCPGILLLTLRLQRSELPENQVMVLTALVFAAFWALYLMARFVAACEQRHAPVRAFGGSAQPEAGAGTAPTGPVAETSPMLRMAELDGKWRCEKSEGEGSPQQRILEIRNGSLALSTVDAQGQIRVRGCARVELVEAAGTKGPAFSSGVELAAGI